MQDVKFENIITRTATPLQKENETFERKKNTKALLYTLGTLALLLLLMAFKTWEKPAPELPLKEDLVQVEIKVDDINLGNDLNGGEGKIQPLVKGDFSPPDAGRPEPKTTPANDSKEEPADPETNDKDNDDAAAVPKPTVRPTKPSTTITDKPISQKPIVNNTQVNNAPPAPKPKVGGPWKRPNGTGTGNGSDVDNGLKNQGNGRGIGDAGDPNGTPNGTGTRITNASLSNRSEIQRLTSQSGTNYRGKATLQLRVDENGRVTNVGSIVLSPANSESRAAKAYLRETVIPKMKFPAGADGRSGTYVFDFDF
jgi:outer membrane biosynthesis protein TonB